MLFGKSATRLLTAMKGAGSQRNRPGSLPLLFRLAADGLLLLLILFSCACSRTVLRPRPLPPEVWSLVAASRAPIELEVEAAPGLKDLSRHGTQFLLVAIPFGEVEVEQPLVWLYNAA